MRGSRGGKRTNTLKTPVGGFAKVQACSGKQEIASGACAEFAKVATVSPLLEGPGKGQSLEGFWALQMLRKTLCSPVLSRGKVLCARRGKRPEVQRADLRERGFFLHTSARGARADCWGRVGKELFFPGGGGSRLWVPASTPLGAPHSGNSWSCGARAGL